MKISHNNHSYLSPSKLNSLASVKRLLSPPNTDDTYTKTDLDKLIIDKSDNLTSNCNEDETNDNILSSNAYAEFKSSFRELSLATHEEYSHYNGSMDTDDALSTPKNVTPFRFSDYSDAPSTPRSTTASISSALKPITTPDFLTKDYTPLNRTQNVDDLLSFAVTNTTTTTTTTSSTLNSWNEANSEFARKEIAHSASTRRPLLSAQNRFLSLSISPPLSRRQDMPVLRGTFVSLYVCVVVGNGL